MTTHAGRNGTLAPTLISLAQQTSAFDGLVIYLPPGANDPITPKLLNEAPGDVIDLIVMRFHCVHCSVDLGPIMKLTAVTEDISNDSIVITVDDDIVYQPAWLETLLAGANQLPNSAVGFSAWNVFDLINGGDYAWAPPNSSADVIEGWSGAAYRKRFFDPSVMIVPDEFRNVDDVWISSWLHRRGVQRVSIGYPMAKSTNATEGLHNRPDFKELNRAAAKIGFRRDG
jgi:hypothetical protein